MEKSTKTMLFLSTYIVVLYWILSNISYITTGASVVMDILSPIFIGGILAFILNRLLSFFEKRLIGNVFKKIPCIYKRKRMVSIILTYFITLASFVAIIFFIVPQVIQSIQTLIEKIPQYTESIQIYSNELLMSLGLSNADLNNILGNWQEIIATFGEFATTTVDKVFDITINFATGLANIFIGLIFSVYILIYKEKLIAIGEKLIRAFTSPKISEKVFYLIGEINYTFTRFIGGQLTEAFILGGMCFLGMKILNLPYAPLVGILIGITSLIPLFGALIGAVPSAFIIFMENPMQALIFMLFLIIIQQIEGNFIYPKIVGNAVGLDGFWVFLAIIVGGNAFGMLGMLLGVPTMAVIYTLAREITNKVNGQKGKMEK